MNLTDYRKKRDFSKTSEPEPEERRRKGPLHFVVHKHQASHLHYDLRLELEGVLKSWTVPKGPSLNPKEKRLAVMVEDHPLEYRHFEGVIPQGNYGAGTVMVWDEGTYEPRTGASVAGEEGTIKKATKEGRLTFVLHGKKLEGEFSLIKTKRGENNWLLIKKNDNHAATEDVRTQDLSASTGRSMEEISREGEL